MEPDTTPMSDDEFRQLVMRTLGEHDARMARMDRQVEKLLDVQLDLAQSHDEHDGRMDQLRRIQARLQRSHDAHEGTMELMRATLDAITDLLRDRRN